MRRGAAGLLWKSLQAVRYWHASFYRFAATEGVLARCLIAFAIALAACGNDDVEEIDCGWAVGDNCWKAFLVDVEPCGDHNSIGSLTANRQRCEYFDGAVVTFGTAFPDPVVGGYPWDFSVTTAGNSCVSHTSLRLEGGAGFRATSPSGEFVMDNQRTALVFSCPDGTQYRLPAEEALACDQQHMPGIVVVAFPGGGSFLYKGASAGAEVLVFNCES